MLTRDRARLLAAVSAVNMMMRDEGSVSSTSHDSQNTPATSVTTSSSLPNEHRRTEEGETDPPDADDDASNTEQSPTVERDDEE